MAYNLYVIASDAVVSILCGAVTLLFTFQLRRDRKARIFLLFVLFECLAEGSLVIARILGLLGNNFQPFFYLGAIFYTCYPAIWLRFIAEYFGLWTPFKRWFARLLLVLPVTMTFGAVTGILFTNLHMGTSGSFSYAPTLFAYFVYGLSEIAVLYLLGLVVRHALEIRLQSHRALIFGFVILFATGLTIVNESLYRICGATGAVIGVLLITGSILRYRLFDPLTELNRELNEQKSALEKAVQENESLLHKVKEADAAKTRFVAYISHELRNPISNIYTTMQSVVEHPEFYNAPLPDDYQVDLKRVNGQARHVTALINDLLDIGRIEAGALKLVLEPVDPAAIMHNVGENVVSALQCGVKFEADYPACLPRICADRVRFTQILTNLLGNAAKFTEHGTITLSANIEDSLMRFTVRDTGVGMSEYVLNHLFEPYTQDARQIGQPHRGAGLGLAITKRLIELHGGTIALTSKQNEGTTVSFTLPLAEVTNAAMQTVPASA